MLTNISKSERRIRFITGSLIWILYLTDSITGGPAHVLAVIGVILLSTAVINFCPYYLACNFSTNKDRSVF